MCGTNTQAVLALPGSDITRPTDLAGKTIASTIRALNYVLSHVIAQYIDLGAGLPTSPAVHETVRRFSARAAVA